MIVDNGTNLVGFGCVGLVIYIYIYIYIKRRKDTREGRDTREREETREGWEVLPTKTKTKQKRKHSTLEN